MFVAAFMRVGVPFVFSLFSGPLVIIGRPGCRAVICMFDSISPDALQTASAPAYVIESHAYAVY